MRETKIIYRRFQGAADEAALNDEISAHENKRFQAYRIEVLGLNILVVMYRESGVWATFQRIYENTLRNNSKEEAHL